jgi:hypothetical protein
VILTVKNNYPVRANCQITSQSTRSSENLDVIAKDAKI